MFGQLIVVKYVQCAKHFVDTEGEGGERDSLQGLYPWRTYCDVSTHHRKTWFKRTIVKAELWSHLDSALIGKSLADD